VSSNARAWGRLALAAALRRTGRLRARLGELGVELFLPAGELCTDNAAMIRAPRATVEALAYPDYLSLDVYATGEGPLR